MPKRPRNPETHHGMDGTDEDAQTRTTPVTASSRRTYCMIQVEKNGQ